jgi:dihydrodipicolinate synthase/N-acetylneuraminate lyase
MIDRDRIKGVCAMMPAFTTPDGGDVTARNSVDVDELERAVDRIVDDGVDMIATMGTFGEFYSLLWSEQQALIEATVRAVRGRVPVMIGCTSTNTREALEKMRFIRDTGADGVITGVPYYMPCTPENGVQFYLDIADQFPDLGIMIYHNPEFHHVTLPVSGFKELVTRPNIVAMKDSHRNVDAFVALMDIVQDRIKIFVRQGQLYPYALLGAAGCWSIDVWMGPWPIFRLRDACAAGDWETAREIASELTKLNPSNDIRWRDHIMKLSINDSGYCTAGPLRPPFRRVPDHVLAEAKSRGERWQAFAARHRSAMVAAV